MMFSYRQAKYGLIFAIIAVGAITTVGIATTMDNSAGNSTNDLFNIFQQEENSGFLGGNDGGGMPLSASNLLGGNDGGGMPL